MSLVQFSPDKDDSRSLSVTSGIEFFGWKVRSVLKVCNANKGEYRKLNSYTKH